MHYRHYHSIFGHVWTVLMCSRFFLPVSGSLDSANKNLSTRCRYGRICSFRKPFVLFLHWAEREQPFIRIEVDNRASDSCSGCRWRLLREKTIFMALHFVSFVPMWVGSRFKWTANDSASQGRQILIIRYRSAIANLSPAWLQACYSLGAMPNVGFECANLKSATQRMYGEKMRWKKKPAFSCLGEVTGPDFYGQWF